MTAAELIDMVRALAPQQSGGLPPATILQMLNVAQEDMSRAAKAPIATVDYGPITDPTDFAWPADAREDGIIAVYSLALDEDDHVTSSRLIPVWDFSTASLYDANWTLRPAASRADLVVWDVAYLAAFPLLVPPPSADAPQYLRVTYAVRPEKMTQLSDEAFHGRLSAYHDGLAYRVSFLLARDGLLLREYDRRVREMRAVVGRAPERVVNPMYSSRQLLSGRA
jgi:hypothetical protein